MKITNTQIKIGDLVSGYQDDDEGGVVGYAGDNGPRLDIRPAYQREFVYKDHQQKAVINTVMRGLPLNTMYWVKSTDPVTGEDHFEVLDGQQRTISICRFVTSGFSVEDPSGSTVYFSGLPQDVKDAILGYELQVYVCEGTDSERLAWFRTINTAGEALTEQELRNANYPGRWLSDAKRYFSKTSGPADELSAGLIKGSAIRQELLEKALAWIAAKQGLGGDEPVTTYMADHQDDPNAAELKRYWREMIEWVDEMFVGHGGKRQKPMDGVDWGRLFNEHGERDDLDPDVVRAQVDKLMSDTEVLKKSGIYEYVLRGSGTDPRSLRLLNLRAFSEADKATMYARQGGKCADPSWTGHDPDQVFERSEMHADHKVPWSAGGKTELSNGQMLCSKCNSEKGAK